MAYSMPPQGDPTNVMGRRSAAFAIDFAIYTAVAVAVLAVTKDHAYVHAPGGACQSLRDSGFSGQCAQLGSRVYTWKTGGWTAAWLIAVVFGLANIVLLQGIGGASVGKLILGLRVVDGQGQVCGIGRAFLRSLLLIVDFVFCFLIGLITASVTHPHRRVGDMAASTYVVALESAGRPIPVAVVPAYQGYGYAQPDQAAWVPPGGAAPGWGAPPPPAWGAPPPAPQETPGWGAAPPAAQAGWGAPPPAAPPPPAWGAPAEAAPPAWGAPPPPPPDPGAPAWGAPPPAPAPSAPQSAAPPPAAPPAWGQPPAPTPPPPAPPAAEPAPPAWNAPPPAPAPAPPAAEPAPDVAPPPAPAPEPKPPAAPPAEGESWWSKAFGDEDDEPGQ